MSTSTTSTEDHQSELRRLRDAIVAAFLADRATLLLERDDTEAELCLAAGELVVLITCSPGAGALEVRQRARAVVARAKAAVVHIVAIGGDHSAASALSSARPFWPRAQQLGFQQIDASGKVKHVAGRRLPDLEHIVAQAASVPLLTEDELALALTKGRQLYIDPARRGRALPASFPWATAVIAAVCVALFALGTYWSGGDIARVLYRLGANSAEAIRSGEIWRLFSSMFLHVNLPHVVLNMIALVSFGVLLERALGWQRYVLLYALSGLGGSLASMVLRGPGLSAGASGAIWGLMTAGAALAMWPRGVLPEEVLAQERRRGLTVLLVNFVYSFTPGIDLWAHFGGGVVGFALIASGLLTRGLVPRSTPGLPEQPQPARSQTTLVVIAWMTGAVMLVSLIAALAAGRAWQFRDPPVFERVRIADTGLSVELPTAVSSVVKETRDGAFRIFLYGSFNSSPVVVEILDTVLSQPVVLEQLDPFLESLREEFQNIAPPGAMRVENAMIVTIAKHRFVAVAHTANQMTVKSWISAFRDHQVVIRILALPQVPPAWERISDRIVGSLQLQ